jgi:hypothetical protein
VRPPDPGLPRTTSASFLVPLTITAGFAAEAQDVGRTDMSVRFGVEGRLTNSERSGHRVRVEDDRAATGGFLIYEWWHDSNGPNGGGAYDSWVEAYDDVVAFFKEFAWAVEWQS